MFIFVLFEVLVIAACIFIAKKMVEKRIGPVKSISIGVDNEQTIEKMENMARKIITTGKFELSDEFDGYEVEVKAKENCIGEVIIKSPATKMRYHFIDGWSTEKLGYTEKGAIAYIAFCLWMISLIIQGVIAIIAVILWLRSMLM